VVSLGVLVTVGAICLGGALVLGDGGGDGGSASVREQATAGGPGGVPSASRWSVSTLQPLQTARRTATRRLAPAPAAVAAGALAGAQAAAGSVSAGVSTAAVTDGAPTAAEPGAVTVKAAVSRVGTGRLGVVQGSVRAPGRAPSMRVRVEVEQGLGVDTAAFARDVLATLNDPQGWGHGGTRSFARTDGAADFRVVLAGSPTAHELCASHAGHPASCGGGELAVINLDQWLDGVPDYRGDLVGFRRYAVNHEVGHVLQHANAYCDPGHLAPVMLQQSEGLHGCLPNPWPYPRR